MEKILFYALDLYLPFSSTLSQIYRRYPDSLGDLKLEIRRFIRRIYRSNRHGDVLSSKYHFEERFGTEDELLEQLFYICREPAPYMDGSTQEYLTDTIMFFDVATPVFLPSSNQNWKLIVQRGNETNDIYCTYECR